MSWRTVVITKRCKLDLSMNYLEVRCEETTKIHLSEIHTIIIDSTAVSLTSALLCELMHRKIKVIFCDEKRNPQSELLPYYGSTDTSAHIKQQILWDTSIKGAVWAELVAEKIRMQQNLLRACGEVKRSDMLEQYIHNIVEADASNREGHAAKVYFGGLFGIGFSRAADCPINAALNYGYSILLSSFNKEIVAAGYLTQIGIFHDNMFNPFNLACDLMEPFRPLVDRIIWNDKPVEFTKEYRYKLVDVLNEQVEIDGSRQYLSNAISIYSRSVISALNERNIGELRFYRPIDASEAIKQHQVNHTEDQPSDLMTKLDELTRQMTTHTEES